MLKDAEKCDDDNETVEWLLQTFRSRGPKEERYSLITHFVCTVASRPLDEVRADQERHTFTRQEVHQHMNWGYAIASFISGTCNDPPSLSRSNRNITRMNWLHQTFGFTKEDGDSLLWGVLNSFCYKVKPEDWDDIFSLSHRRELEWIRKTCSITIEDLRGWGYISFVCKKGRVDILKWLHQIYVLSLDEDIRINQSVAVRDACEKGQLCVLQLLHQIFGLSLDIDIRAKDGEGIQHACYNGHKVTIQWIHKIFGLDEKDIPKSFYIECLAGVRHTDLCQWIEREIYAS